MIFSGKNYRVLPTTNRFSFAFENIVVNDSSSYKKEIGFSNQTGSLKLGFSFKENSIYDVSGNILIGSYQTGSPFTIRGEIDAERYKYYINDDLIFSNRKKADEDFYFLLANTENSGQSFSANVKLACDDIPLSVDIPESFSVVYGLTGRIVNLSSDIYFPLFDTKVIYKYNDYPEFDSSLSGRVIAGTGNYMPINFADINPNKFNSKVEGLLIINSAIGEIQKEFNLNKVSGYVENVYSLFFSQSSVSVESMFSGSGLPNQFKFIKNEGTKDVFFGYDAFNEQNEQIEKTLKISMKASSPATGTSYVDSYVTGYKVTNSGKYSLEPSLNFKSYYHVSGVEFINSGILLSSGCTGKTIPVTFISQDGWGAGASGNAYGKTMQIGGIYGTTGYYYVITGFDIVNGGTGYNSMPLAKMWTGNFPSCYDVPLQKGYNQLSFQPFTGNGLLKPDASYLCGEPIMYSGSGQGYYRLSGITITNPGSGYSAVYPPMVTVVRAVGDVQTTDATGTFSMNTSTGKYTTTGAWTLKTGTIQGSLFDVPIVSGYFSGSSSIGASERDFVARIGFTDPTYTGLITNTLLITGDGGAGASMTVTGVKTYNKNCDYLKVVKNKEFTFDPYLDEVDFFF